MLPRARCEAREKMLFYVKKSWFWWSSIEIKYFRLWHFSSKEFIAEGNNEKYPHKKVMNNKSAIGLNVLKVIMTNPNWWLAVNEWSCCDFMRENWTMINIYFHYWWRYLLQDWITIGKFQGISGRPPFFTSMIWMLVGALSITAK